jgi:hypothetical protein|tara:strand:+ start:2229 stop:2483 length:255 start_codon:yes stop_codon:yes gene_type:complete
MPKQKAEHLITDLHERFADDLTSPEQIALLAKVKSHIHNMNEAGPADPTFLDTVERLVAEIEVEHPTAASILEQLLSTLKNIGV